MKRKLFAVLIWMLIACMLAPTAIAEDNQQNWQLLETRSKPATCTEQGVNAYISDAGEVKTETVPALGHKWGDWEIQTAATCLETGVEIHTCTRCNQATETRTIPAKGHTWGDWTTTTPATCAEEGVQTKTCSVCGAKETKAIAKDSSAHQFGEWKVTKDATCKEDGTKVRTCSSCGKEETQTISKSSAHQFGEWKVTKAATCSEDGVQTRSCSVCGKQESSIIPKTGEHTWSDWTVSKEPTCVASGMETRKCTGCGKTENSSIEKLEHQWSEWVVKKEPTCKERGKKQRSCARCGAVENLNIKELGHEAEEWTVTKEPTCQKVGEKQGACIRCGKILTKKLNRVDHDYEEWETVTEATDFSKGKRQSVCRFCKRKKTEEYYPDGTLAKDLDNDPEAVKELQTELTVLGFLKKDITSVYDKPTIEAVKKAQKGLGLKQDGICWPGLSKLLGLKNVLSAPLSAEAAEAASVEAEAELPGGIGGGGDEEGIGPSPEKYKLQLEVKKTSPKKDYYSLGDELVYEWTLTNASKTATCKKTKMYWYDIKKGIKQKEEVIEEIGSLKPGESAIGTFTYTVTSEDVLTGKFSLGFIGKGNMGGKVESNPVMFTHFASAGDGGIGGVWTPPEEEALTITKKVTNTPENTYFFVKGETIKFEIEIKNKIADAVDDVIVTDELFGGSWKKTIGTLASGDSKTYEVEYKVKTSDVSKGEVVNTAVVSYTQDGDPKMSKATAKAMTGMNSDGLYIYKTCTNLPKNGLFFMPGETVEFEIQVINPTSKTTFKNLEVYDLLHSKKNPYKTLSQLTAGDSVTYIYKTKVTKYQGKIGKLTNSVMVSYKDPNKKKRLSQSNECTVPCGLEGQDGVIVEKKVISKPDNGSYYEEGEEIRYEIKVTNNTIKDIIAMDLRDSLAKIDDKGYRTIQSGETLAAGETYEIHFSYFVTEDDVENTKVTNVASVYWSVEKDEFTETYSDPVIVPTAPVISDKKAEIENLAGEACTPSLTAMGEGVAQRDLTECGEHTETAQEAREMIADGDYEAASLLWDGEIENLYLEWEKNTSGESRRIAENEQAAFEHQMTALEASLSLVAGEVDAKAIVAEERMEKCIGLCYELHTAPEGRPDSAGGTHTELKKGKAAANCSRDVNYTEAGPVHLEDDQCESHTLTTQLTQALLTIAEDDEDREIAWLRAQSNWLFELDTMYNTWYLSAEPAQKALIAADRMSFDELIKARREALAVMYPDDPATAAEVLANMIMHRTELICSILHKAGVLKD